MNYRTLIFSTLTLLFLSGCANTTEKKQTIQTTSENKKVNDLIEEQLVALDTAKVTYPIKIGNDDGLVSVLKISNSKADHFVIDLDYRKEKVFSIYADKYVLIDSTQNPMFLDTLHSDYTRGARLVDVKYLFVRGGTLYFSATLENVGQQKKMEGRFNVFYSPARKGEVYGWITDTVYPMRPIE
ncbi:MAG: hypothetical protein AAF489_15480 [Bacteroidota bacterium]